MFVLFAGEKYYFFKSENFYFNLNLLLNIRELAKNTVSSTQVRFVMETGPVELKYFQFLSIFSPKKGFPHLSESLQCGSEIILSSVCLQQIFCVASHKT